MTFEECFAKSNIPVGFRLIAQSGWNWALIELAAERSRHEAEVAKLNAIINEIESLPSSEEAKVWLGSGYNPQQCARLAKLYYENNREIASLQEAAARHEAEVKGLLAKILAICDTPSPDLYSSYISGARWVRSQIVALLRPQEKGAAKP